MFLSPRDESMCVCALCVCVHTEKQTIQVLLLIKHFNCFKLWAKQLHCNFIITSLPPVNFTVHSKKTCAATDSQKLGDHIVKALIDMKNLYGV